MRRNGLGATTLQLGGRARRAMAAAGGHSRGGRPGASGRYQQAGGSNAEYLAAEERRVRIRRV